MTQEALKKMYQLLLTEPHAPTVCAQLERIAREALADHAMRETQRLGQEIEQKRTWVGLTKQQQLDIFAQSGAKKRSEHEHYMAIEQALKEQNT